VQAEAQHDLAGLICCPTCDLVYTAPKVAMRQRAICTRCHRVLIAPRRKAGKQLIALAMTVLILIVAAVLFPFLSIGAGGMHHDASIYVLVPIIRDRPPAPLARPAFRLSEGLVPWSMAEIFAIGCAVALVKLSDLADVAFGPAAWMFAVLVVLVVATDGLMCRYSIWASLDQ
jgi:paraquat-inducible protein A